MQTAEDRIKFAVDLAAKNLDFFRAGDWLNLKEDLGLYLHGERGIPQTMESLGGIVVSAIERPLAQDYTREGFLKLQEQIRKFLMPLARSSTLGKASPARVQEIRPAPITLDWSVVPAGNQAQLYATGSVEDCFLTRLFFLLGTSPQGRILICPGCEIIFYREGKMRYCSRRCANRMAARRFQKRKAAKNAR